MGLVLLVVGGCSALLAVHLQRTAGLRQVEGAAQVLTSTIYRGLESSMIRNSPDEMQEILTHLQGEAMLRRVAIYAASGRIWSSTDPGEIGTQGDAPRVEEAITSGRPRVFEVPQSGELTAVLPIPNRDTCAPCHAEDPAVLGAISVSLDTRRLYAQSVESGQWMALLVAVSVGLAVAGLSVASSRILLRPLAALVAGVKRIASGDYDARVAWTSQDEMGLLASAINDMAERIQRYTAGLRREVRRLTRWLSNLELFSRTLVGSPRLEDALGDVAKQTGRLVRADGCRIVLHVPVASRTVFAWGVEDSQRCRAEVPLSVKERQLGVLVAVREGDAPFEPEDVTLLEAVANLVAIAVENTRLFEEVREKERLRGQLLGRIMHAQEEERRRIARELHDGVGQALTALMLRMDMAVQAARESPGEMSERLEALREVGESTLDEVRRITYDLRPAALDDLSLAAAVATFARTRLEGSGIAVLTDTGGCADRRLPSAIETALFRIAQEALTNVLRHSRANQASVSLRCPEGGPLVLVVEDDGRGFDLVAVQNDRDRPALGLAGMRERAEIVGGELIIATAPGRGTHIEVRVPLPRESTGGEAT